MIDLPRVFVGCDIYSWRIAAPVDVRGRRCFDTDVQSWKKRVAGAADHPLYQAPPPPPSLASLLSHFHTPAASHMLLQLLISLSVQTGYHQMAKKLAAEPPTPFAPEGIDVATANDELAKMVPPRLQITHSPLSTLSLSLGGTPLIDGAYLLVCAGCWVECSHGKEYHHQCGCGNLPSKRAVASHVYFGDLPTSSLCPPPKASKRRRLIAVCGNRLFLRVCWHPGRAHRYAPVGSTSWCDLKL